jgi:hypothetical protein
MNRSIALAPLLALAASLVACSAETDTGPTAGDDEGAVIPNIETLTGKSVQWVYSGPLPSLESPKVEVSIPASVALVTGLLPEGYDVAKLPPYARTRRTEAGRTELAIGYPVATAATDKINPERNAPYRNWPGDNKTLYSIPFTPSVKDSANSDATMWGGFPFIKYSSVGHALHGPIDVAPEEEGGQVWKLKRAPVSKGCNRMAGEHIVELAHLIGTDMATKELGREHRAPHRGQGRRRCARARARGADLLERQGRRLGLPRAPGLRGAREAPLRRRGERLPRMGRERRRVPLLRLPARQEVAPAEGPHGRPEGTTARPAGRTPSGTRTGRASASAEGEHLKNPDISAFLCSLAFRRQRNARFFVL